MFPPPFGAEASLAFGAGVKKALKPMIRGVQDYIAEVKDNIKAKTKAEGNLNENKKGPKKSRNPLKRFRGSRKNPSSGVDHTTTQIISSPWPKADGSSSSSKPVGDAAASSPNHPLPLSPALPSMRVPSDLTPAQSRPPTPSTIVTTAHNWIPRPLTPPDLHQSSSEKDSPKPPPSSPNAPKTLDTPPSSPREDTSVEGTSPKFVRIAGEDTLSNLQQNRVSNHNLLSLTEDNIRANPHDRHSTEDERITSADEAGAYDVEQNDVQAHIPGHHLANFPSPEDQEKEVWGPIKDIPDANYVALVQTKIVRRFDRLYGIYVKDTKSGSFNVAKFVNCLGRNYVVKVPAAGWGARWTESRQKIMRSEIATMQLIEKETEGKFPVPHIYAYDLTLGNEFGAPYIIMDNWKDVRRWRVWYDWRDEHDGFYYNGDEENPVKERFRETFLRSLAQEMALLAPLQFDRIGMITNPDISNPGIAPHLIFEPDGEGREKLDVRKVYHSSSHFYTERLLRKALEHPAENSGPGAGAAFGFWNSLIRNSPLRASTSTNSPNPKKESFVLGHLDFDAQNILCNPLTGEVTGIIDWDGASTVPRCVGYTSVPLFLRLDWTSWYSFASSEGPILSAPKLEYYRGVYADAMKTAMGGRGDCQYTANSHVYNAIHSSLYPAVNRYNGEFQDLSRKIICRVFPCEDPEAVQTRLGDGRGAGEWLLRKKLPKLLAPDEL